MRKTTLPEQLATLIGVEQKKLDGLHRIRASLKTCSTQAVKVELLKASQYFLTRALTQPGVESQDAEG